MPQMKISLGPTNEKALGDVKALKDVGYFGTSSTPDYSTTSLLFSSRRLTGHQLKIPKCGLKLIVRKREMNQMQPLVKDEVVNWACTKRLLHTLSQVLDFGYPGVFRVSRLATRSMIEKWFNLQWENRQDFRAKLT
ncbi:hypothetical protein EV368DRAFT_64034 [Lentinula lateritia]|uniref:Uncharacterized protein n=1 Tax=Lentinula aff. lateritia TaxID=2804960 RepID=A0ACC1TT60_9AGAR|nr:hypothetical protein F5876DRAFT_67677 [Lentinula aff. lateritia]KAJ3853492.1 hypothetical protein EV368DRAFT_64034 [Lentinula lateritia]